MHSKLKRTLNRPIHGLLRGSNPQEGKIWVLDFIIVLRLEIIIDAAGLAIFQLKLLCPGNRENDRGIEQKYESCQRTKIGSFLATIIECLLTLEAGQARWRDISFGLHPVE